MMQKICISNLTASAKNKQQTKESLDLTDVELSDARALLNRISNSWSKRAQVRRASDESLLFDKRMKDYSEELLPFKDHPDYLHLSDEQKNQILSCGWIIYNQKTIEIETKIINPVCVQIISNEIPGVEDSVSKHIASETLVDESYHVLLVVKAIELTKQHRNLDLKIPSFSLIDNMQRLQDSYPEKWRKTIIQLTTAIVSEIFISDYLKLLSENKEIQPFNRLTVAAHRRDEMAHGNIFKQLTKCVYANLSTKERNFFASILPKPVRWFSDRELLVWEQVLGQLKINNFRDIIEDYKIINENRINFINYSELIELANDIGITNLPIGMNSFFEEGLIQN